MPKEKLPDSLFIFVMCCCAIAIGAVVFVFVYYCYLNGKACFHGHAPPPSRRARRHRIGATVEGQGVSLDAAGEGDGDGAESAIAMMETRLLDQGAPAPSSSQPVAIAGTADHTALVMDAAALSRAKFNTENVKIRDLDAGDDYTVSGVNAPHGKAAAAAYYDGSERLEFLVLPEKAASVMASNASARGSDAPGDAASAEEMSNASGASTAHKRHFNEWINGVVKAYRESVATKIPLEDATPVVSTGASSPYSSDHNTDSEHPQQPMVPTARRLQMMHRLSHASDSSMSTQPSTTVPRVGPGVSPTQSNPASPQAMMAARSGPVAPPPLQHQTSGSSQPQPPPPRLTKPHRKGTGSTEPARARGAGGVKPATPVAAGTVTLAQLMEDPFGRNFPQGAPVILTPDMRGERLAPPPPPPPPPAAAGATESTAVALPTPAVPAGAATSGAAGQPHTPKPASGTPRRILSDTTSSSSSRRS